jgi:hypothetical protein
LCKKASCLPEGSNLVNFQFLIGGSFRVGIGSSGTDIESFYFCITAS